MGDHNLPLLIAAAAVCCLVYCIFRVKFGSMAQAIHKLRLQRVKNTISEGYESLLLFCKEPSDRTYHENWIRERVDAFYTEALLSDWIEEDYNLNVLTSEFRKSIYKAVYSPNDLPGSKEFRVELARVVRSAMRKYKKVYPTAEMRDFVQFFANETADIFRHSSDY